MLCEYRKSIGHKVKTVDSDGRVGSGYKLQSLKQLDHRVAARMLRALLRWIPNILHTSRIMVFWYTKVMQGL